MKCQRKQKLATEYWTLAFARVTGWLSDAFPGLPWPRGA